MRFSTRLFAIFVIAFALIAAAHAHAQSISLNLSSFGYTDEVDIAATPANPAPGQPVHIAIDSSTADLDRSEITWTLDGKVIQKQVGLKSIDIIAGSLGQKSTVTAAVTTPMGESITQSVTIIPGQVDMIWQTDTYTPPFYEGKAMYTEQSTLTVVAIPHIFVNGREQSPNSLLYQWNRDGQILGSQSGYGKNTLTLTDTTLPRSTYVSVTITSYDGSATGQGGVAVTPIPPKAILYEDQPRYGVLSNHALVGDYTMTDPEIDLVAYPYFFSAGLSGENVGYQWETGNTTISDVTGNRIVFRNDTGAEGRSLVHVAIKHATDILQFAESQLLLNFKS